MTPRRLVDEAPQSLQAQLLRAGRGMQPPASTYQRTIHGLGLATGVLGGAKLAIAAGTLGSRWALTSVALKWVAIGFLGGSSVLGIARVAGIGVEQPSPRNVAPIGPIRPATQAPKMTSTDSRPLGELDVATAATKLVAAASLAAPGGSTGNARPAQDSTLPDAVQTADTSIAASEGTLRAEVALVDRIRRSIAGGRSQEALRLIAQHENLFDRPRLSEEVAFLRVKALEQAGSQFAAEEALRQFRARYPASPLGERRSAQ